MIKTKLNDLINILLILSTPPTTANRRSMTLMPGRVTVKTSTPLKKPASLPKTSL